MAKELVAEFDENGYATDRCLESIYEYGGLPDELLRFLCRVWREPGYAREIAPGEFVFWTGCRQNEELLNACQRWVGWPSATWNHIAMSGFLWAAWTTPTTKKALESIREAQQIVWRLAWRDDSKYPWRAY